MLVGVVLATAVIVGALVVGDSVKYSLRKLTLDRLGPVSFSVSGQRFVTQRLVERLAVLPELVEQGLRPHPLLVLTGSVEFKSETRTRRASQVLTYGIQPEFWELLDTTGQAPPVGDGIVLNEPTATALGVTAGSSVTLWLELPSAVPRDTLLGQKENEAQEISLKVLGVLPTKAGAGQLALQPNQQFPMVAFLSLPFLQRQLDLSEISPSRRDPQGSPARINSIFFTAVSKSPMASATDIESSQQQALLLTRLLGKALQLNDLALRQVSLPTGSVSVESDQLIIETRLGTAIQTAAQGLSAATSPVMVYLANRIENVKDSTKYSMYSTMAGLDLLSMPKPFGTFDFTTDQPTELAPGEVVINEYLAEDLHVQVGDAVRVYYHKVGTRGELPEETIEFNVRGIVKLKNAGADRSLTPTVKGITDAESLDDWEQPFPMKLNAVTNRDDDYWDLYRATPKLFLPLAEAQRLWPSRYGLLTSIRTAPAEGTNQFGDKLAAQIIDAVSPVELGLAVLPIKAVGLAGASGSTDFSGLFAAFSFFIILAASILIGLLFRLGVEQRVREFGVLGAIGFSPSQIRQIALTEGSVSLIFGVAIGTFTGVAYAELMLYGLRTWWNAAVGTQLLFLDVQPASLAIGAVIGLIAAAVPLWWGLSALKQIPLRDQLAGKAVAPQSKQLRLTKRTRSQWQALLSIGSALLIVAANVLGLLPAGEVTAGLGWSVLAFFTAGMLVMVGCVWGLSAWLTNSHLAGFTGKGWQALTGLGLANARRQPSRSLTTVMLISFATFVIVAVAVGQKNPAKEAPDKNSGNGGFSLVAESSSPLLYDLNTAAGRTSLGLTDLSSTQAALFDQLSVYPFRVKPGEEASCLNLFQAQSPTILGVPQALIERGGFRFVGTGGKAPWSLLNASASDGAVPALGDMNTLMFSLKKAVGQTVPVTSFAGAGPALGPTGHIGSVETASPFQQLRIAGMLEGSIFQGVLLISEDQFLKLFPEQKGYRYFLIEAPLANAPDIAELFESKLAPYGFDTEPVSQRLRRFLAVQNTYLSTFQALGGLGLLLGTFGLATVMLRNVLERQGEIALLQAIGFSQWAIGSLIVIENSLLLLWGLAAGTLAAVLAMWPHLSSTGADVNWSGSLGLLVGIFVVGLMGSVVAIVAAVRLPIAQSLKGD